MIKKSNFKCEFKKSFWPHCELQNKFLDFYPSFTPRKRVETMVKIMKLYKKRALSLVSGHGNFFADLIFLLLSLQIGPNLVLPDFKLQDSKLKNSFIFDFFYELFGFIEI